MITERNERLGARYGHDHCLLCGDRNPGSWRLTFDAAGADAVVGRFQAHRGLQGYPEILHGGVIAALLDAAMTHCLFHRGVRSLTGDLRVRFVRPVRCDAAVDLSARIVSSGRTLHRLQAELLEGGQVMAWAEAKFIRRRAPR